MRYDRMLFYIGVMFVLVGLGTVMLGYRLPGAIIMCVGVVFMPIGFMMMKFNIILQRELVRKGKA